MITDPGEDFSDLREARAIPIITSKDNRERLDNDEKDRQERERRVNRMQENYEKGRDLREGLHLANQITKESAFARFDSEKNIPINDTVRDFKFTRNWFKKRNQTTWSTFLAPQFPGENPIKMIQIGVFEGMDLVWCMQNICRHVDSKVVAIDPWKATTKLSQEFMEGAYERACHNLGLWADKIEIVRDFSQDALFDVCPNYYDLVIIDGDHRAKPVFDDAVRALSALKVGGWMVFDDVRNRVTKKTDHVVHGIQMFLEDYHQDVELVWQHRHCDCYVKVRQND